MLTQDSSTAGHSFASHRLRAPTTFRTDAREDDPLPSPVFRAGRCSWGAGPPRAEILYPKSPSGLRSSAMLARSESSDGATTPIEARSRSEHKVRAMSDGLMQRCPLRPISGRVRARGRLGMALAAANFRFVSTEYCKHASALVSGRILHSSPYLNHPVRIAIHDAEARAIGRCGNSAMQATMNTTSTADAA